MKITVKTWEGEEWSGVVSYVVGELRDKYHSGVAESAVEHASNVGAGIARLVERLAEHGVLNAVDATYIAEGVEREARFDDPP